MMARETALKEVPNGKLRRLLAYNVLFKCADVRMGDSTIFLGGRPHKYAALAWRGGDSGR